MGPPQQKTGWFNGALLLFFSMLLALGSAAAAPPFAYDLRSGDHIVYRQTLRHFVDNHNTLGQKGADGRPLYQSLDMEELLTWTTHVLVLEAGSGGNLIGIQRHLDEAKLIRFEVAGEDRLERRLPVFESSLAGQRVFSEAVRLDPQGNPTLPWVAAREWHSKTLFEAHEFLPLPPEAVRAGLRWAASGYRDFDYQVMGREEVEGENCLIVEGKSMSITSARSHNIHLAYNYCAFSGLMRQLDLEALYLGALFQENREHLTIEFVSRQRDQSLETWLSDPSLRQGVLQALLLPGSSGIPAGLLHSLLDSSLSETDLELALAVNFRRQLPTPSGKKLAELATHSDPVVRRLALRLLPEGWEELSSILSSASDDPDPFVRETARKLREGTPPAGGDKGGERAWSFLPAWKESCSQPPAPALPRKAIRPGTYLESFELPDHSKWPFLVQIPIDYGEDSPLPLVIYLSGNGGSAVEGMMIAARGFSRTGYLVVYPQASGYWWDDAPAAAFQHLLPELKRRYNIDTDRIYLTGLSNGGTGTFFYSAFWPQDFTAAVSAMGAGFWPLNAGEIDEVEPDNLANLPMLFLHGEKDQTIRADTTRRTVSRLRWRKAPLEAHYFPNLAHGVVVGASDEGRTLKFFQRFQSRRVPRSIRFGMSSLEYPRHYWVEILENSKGPMRVEGEIGEDNTIRLKARNVVRLRLLLRPDLLPAVAPIRVLINGKEVFAGPLVPDCPTLKKSLEETADPWLAYSNALDLTVP